MSNFCHLHLHDQFSLLDGFGSAENYAKKAKELGQKFLGLTNHGNIDGLIKFQKECKKQKISPILGVEAYIVEDAKIKEKGDDRGHVTLLVKNQQGFENLCKMLTYANLTGFYYRPRIDYDLLYDNCDGLIVLTGCADSFLLKKGGYELFLDLKDKLKEDIYLEVMPHIFDKSIEVNKYCIQLANEFDIPLVGTNDCHYINKDDYTTHEVLLAIQTKAKWDDPNRFRFGNTGLHLRSRDEMDLAFQEQNILNGKEIDEALESTIEIAEKCKGFSIKKQGIFLPKVPGYEDKDPGSFIRMIAEKRLVDLKLDKDPTYLRRLDDEDAIINSKNFAPYFLIVWDLIRWCKQNDIMTGPGRGSAAGSLMAYLLCITTVDPIKFDLLFSRFIADDRVDFPDIDLDFPDYKRHLIREHLEKLYGENNVASISTFLTMKGRAVIRDVSRVFDIPIPDANEFAKSIEYDNENEGNSLEESFKTNEGKSFAQKYPDVVEHMIKLEGQVRGGGQHAAGLIISADDLTQGTKGNLVTRSNLVVSNWDMEDSEYMGLMKLDVLGLNALSVLNETKHLVKKNYDKDIIYEKIPLDDLAVYKDIADGYTIGIFQMNTWSSTKLAKEIKADNFNQLSDIIALVRPGPADSGQTDEYTKRKWGQDWIKKHPIYEEITKNTFGIIVYQEQVMQVINKVAGLSYSVADKIRKIISKKGSAKDFVQYKNSFIEGCKEQKIISNKEAEAFWEELQSHARYSFNLSHSVSYAHLGYWCAHAKHYFPTEFICANLTYGQDSKKEEIINEAYRLGLQVVLPQVGISDAYQWVAKDNKLYCPFIEIKGIGEKTALQCTNFEKAIQKKGSIKKKSTGLIQPFFTTGKEKKIKIEKEKTKSKMEQMLEDIGAFGNEPVNDINKYFSFNVKVKVKEGEPVGRASYWGS